VNPKNSFKWEAKDFWESSESCLRIKSVYKNPSALYQLRTIGDWHTLYSLDSCYVKNSVISPLVSLRLVITFWPRAQLHIDMTLDNPFYMDIISLNIAWQILSHNTFPHLCDCLFLRQPISKDCVTHFSRKYVLFSINLTTVYRLSSIIYRLPSGF